MIRMYASHSHTYTHLILALGIVREPTVWGFMTSKYPGTHDIGLPTDSRAATATFRWGFSAAPKATRASRVNRGPPENV